VDIKVITGAVGLVITIGGLFIFQGQLIQRIDVLEAQKAPNIKPLEQDIAINKAEIAVLKAKIDEMKSRSDNPLGGGL
jgi:cell division protein FtsB